MKTKGEKTQFQHIPVNRMSRARARARLIEVIESACTGNIPFDPDVMSFMEWNARIDQSRLDRLEREGEVRSRERNRLLKALNYALLCNDSQSLRKAARNLCALEAWRWGNVVEGNTPQAALKQGRARQV